MKNKSTLYTFLFFLLICSFSVKGETLHILMFITDEKTDPVYESCQQNKKLIKAQFQLIAETIDIQVKYHFVSFTKENLKTSIAQLKCSEEDVILFIYNGHGYNLGGSKFPYMNFKEKSNAEEHINLYDIHQKLKAKEARLLITLGDLCNAVLNLNSHILLSDELRRLGYNKLFKHYQGDIIVTSSKKGEYSYVYKDGSGSFFFLGFLDALHYAIAKSEFNWKFILEKTKANTVKRSKGAQEPYFMNHTKLRRIKNTFEN